MNTVTCDSDVTMTVTAPLTHLCPHVDEVDNGTITLTWRVNGYTLELHSLREYLNGFKYAEVSHEEITDLIRHEMSVTPGVEVVSVETTWDTAGMEVKCSTSPTLAEAL